MNFKRANQSLPNGSELYKGRSGSLFTRSITRRKHENYVVSAKVHRNLKQVNNGRFLV